ncbi:M23 family metallopeptidase [Candidatus Microgenomates bacterium]|nr:M23 family metallopeptidase [Candidatus Microgenomates bacterium]PIP74975.1 MAG: hypothetical protein COW87_00935 [Candidatus Levybacteria bacterium CG22_combo_CG10-13_8_21_14_all_35_11]
MYRKLFKIAGGMNHLRKDPFGFIIDSLVSVIVSFLIPIPFAGTLMREFRGPVLGCLMSLIVLGVVMISIVGMVIMSPVLVSSSLVQKITTFLGGAGGLVPADGSFLPTTVPGQIPLGGSGLEFSSITAGFMDPVYFLSFGMNHTGIDLVPNARYYANSPSFKEHHRVIVYTTHSGKVIAYIDGYGGETVEVLAGDGKLKTVYKHMKHVFVSSGADVQAGSAVGEMGMTGFATAEHVHYEIRLKSGNNWVAVNPLTYIK